MPDVGPVRQSSAVDRLKVFRATIVGGPDPYAQGGFSVIIPDARALELAFVNCRGAIQGPSSPAVTYSAHVEPILGTNEVLVKLYVTGPVASTVFDEPVGDDASQIILDITAYGY